jgi:hypothetical protein
MPNHGLLRRLAPRNDGGNDCYSAKSVSGIGIAITSLARFWNETFSCLPVFIAASIFGWRDRRVGVAAALLAGLDLQVRGLAVIDLQLRAGTPSDVKEANAIATESLAEIFTDRLEVAHPSDVPLAG